MKKLPAQKGASAPRDAYDPSKIEKKWQKEWAKKKLYASKETGAGAKRSKFYVLDMFPYPSGEGLHVGHPKGYIATDVISRMKRMQGMNVLHPMGFDAFGLPAENYAIKMKTHPEAQVKKNVARYKDQLELLGFDYDWSREVNTTDPAYYKWTQWIFLQLWKKGLAFESFEPINWCPSCKTGLANEDLDDGRCERCGTPVEKKPLRQWVLKITKYADRLLQDLDIKVLPNGDYFMLNEQGEPSVVQMNEVDPGKVRTDKPFVERDAISAFIEHWEGGRFMVLKWKKVDWMTPLTGGIEKGQTAEEAARREITEETGFKNIELVKQADKRFHSVFFHVPKDENRVGHFTSFHFKLKNGEQLPISKEEQGNHEITWVDRAKVRETLTAEAQKIGWALLMDEQIGTGAKPLLDWPESIKELQRNWIGRSEGAEIEFDLTLTKNKPRMVILHGFEGSAKTNFLPWLKAEFEKRGHEVQAPELPNSFSPSESEQVDYVLKNCTIDEDTVIVGHSLGAIVAMKALMKLNKPMSGLLLVAPALDPKFHTGNDLRKYAKNFSWNIDYARVNKLAGNGKIAVLSDTQEPKRAPYLKFLAKQLQAGYVEAKANEEHFCAAEEPMILKCCTPSVKVFTTRPDTLFGVTYIVLAPEHMWVNEFMDRLENRAEVQAYVDRAKNATAIDRTDATKEKTGVELKGIKAVNPATGEEVPVWVSDYVLGDYGTGAVMAVPAHDDRDFAFAKKYKLPIKQVIVPEFGTKRSNEERRDGTCAIIFDPKSQRYAVTEDGTGTYRLCSGGLDAGEDPKTGALREVLEESGLHDFKSFNTIAAVDTHFYNRMKKVNRVARSIAYFGVLDSAATKPAKLEAHEQKFKLAWATADEILKNWQSKYTDGDADHWIWLLGLAVGRLIESGIDTTSDPATFKPMAYTGGGTLTNSKQFNGKPSESVMKEITEFAGGSWVAQYKLRDWVFSRQRYWGEPIPLIHCEKCGVVAVPEKDLPVKLPNVKSYEPTGTGESPLAAIDEWVYVKCPQCQSKETGPKHFILDFDGVLGDTWEARIEAKLRLGMVKSREESIAASMAYFEKKPNHARDTVLSEEQLKKEIAHERIIGAEVLKINPPLFAEFVREVKKFKGVKMGVVSSGSGLYVRGLLEKAGIPFTHILAFEDHHSKEEKIERICRDWGVDVKDVYYFTDTKSDVYELENLLDRQKLVGCAWGYHGLDKLREVLPERQILRDFKDIHRFFKHAGMARRETNTMPQWAGSCWYYLRYEDPQNKKALVDPRKEKYWSPVDLYVGGAEHATRHLIYARFWHKFLYDIGAVSTTEPFIKLQSVGLIMGEDGRKMGKRFGNVVNPDDVVASYGADTMRVYEMFMGPFDQQITWSTSSMVGARRFIERVWKLAEKVLAAAPDQRIIHKTIKKVSEDIAEMRFNTAISSMMICLNELEKAPQVGRADYEAFLKLLAPFAPHVTEELWSALGNKKSIHISAWPAYDQRLIVDDAATIILQVNGKVRGSFTSPLGASKEALETMARSLPEAQKWLNGSTVKRVIVVPDKLVNIVV